MNRDRELEQVLKRLREELSSDASYDVQQILARYEHLMPELGEAVANILAERQPADPLRTLPPASDAPSTIDHWPGTSHETPLGLELRYVGEYRLEQLLGRGAFGEVWQATQTSLNRPVAIKLLLAQHSTPELLRRFRREAEVLAQVHHPHIVNVLEINSDQGRHYIAMELVEGENFKQRIERGLPACRWAAEQMLHLAKAIAHAHDVGVVHRDLKPANLLLSKSQELKVTDFGLAKRSSSESELTIDGTVLGTLAYMPPEQALGKAKDVGPAADIYAIGATLYHLLTGQPPFPTQPDLPPAAIFDEIRDVDPIPPRRLRPDRPIGRDLETICLKCLAKEPERRYVSAQALAEDLGRFLAGEPIAARPVSWRERAWLRIKKQPVIASLAAAVIVALLIVAGLAIQGLELAQAVVSTKQTLADQTQELDQTKTEKTAAQTRELAARQQENLARLQAQREAEQRTVAEYLADMNEAQTLWERGEWGRLRELLALYKTPDGFDPRGFEWHFFQRQISTPAPLTFPSQASPWNRLAFSANGQQLAALDRTGKLVAWAFPSGEERFQVEGPAHSFAFSNVGKYCIVLRSAEKGTFSVLNADTGESLQQFQAERFTTCFAIHPAEDKLLTGNSAGELFLRELPSGKPLLEVTAAFKDRAQQRRSLDIEHGAILEVAFSPRGDTFAVGWEDGTVQLWQTQTRTIHRHIDNPHRGPVVGAAFSPDGTLLATQSAGVFDRRQETFVPGDVKVTILATGGKLATFVPHPTKLAEEAVLATEQGSIPFGMFRPAFSADSAHLFTTGDQAVTRWNAHTGEREEEYPGHDGLVYAVALTSDGAQLAATGHDGVIRVWPSAGYKPYTLVATALGGIRGLRLSPDDRHFAAICDRGIELRVPDIRSGLLSPPRRLTDSTLWIWDAATGEKRFSEDVDYLDSPLQFSAQGSELWGCGKRYLLGAEVVSAEQPHTKLPYGTVELAGPEETFVVRYSPYQPDIELWHHGDSEPYARIPELAPTVTVVAISPTGTSIATGDRQGLVSVWASADGRLLHECRAHTDEITALAFHPRGDQLLSGGRDRKLYAWNMNSGQRSGAFPGHRREISGLAFTRDGQRFVSSSGQLSAAPLVGKTDGEVRLWDFATGRLCVELKSAGEMYSGVAISSDGHRIFAAANTLTSITPGRIIVWDGTPESQRAKPATH